MRIGHALVSKQTEITAIQSNPSSDMCLSATLTAEIIGIPVVLGFRHCSLRIDPHAADSVALHASTRAMKAENPLISIRYKHLPGIAHRMLGRVFFNRGRRNHFGRCARRIEVGPNGRMLSPQIPNADGPPEQRRVASTCDVASFARSDMSRSQ